MKNLVVLCDGTGQKLDTQQTNVVRLLRLLNQSSDRAQIAYYDAGLGTTPRTGGPPSPWRESQRLAGLAFGWGLLGKVASAYAFLVDRYEPGDRLYLFGFSRGAFTVRLIAGLLHQLGILKPEARHLLPYAFELYKEHDSLQSEVGREKLRALRNDFREQFSRSQPVEIEFLGLWDTVKAFGFLRPRSFPHTRHNPSVKQVRHALSLDERRRSFQVTTWGGLDGFVERPADQEVKEVWFGGDHSDVGGGHSPEESGLSWLSFGWMLGELRCDARHLHLDNARLDASHEMIERVEGGKCSIKRHDLRTGLWAAADLCPRPELVNAPARGGSERIPNDLSVPEGWPKRPFIWTPTEGIRHFELSRRNGKILVHASVRDLPGATGRKLAGVEGIEYVASR